MGLGLMIVSAILSCGCQGNQGKGAKAATGVTVENLAGRWSLMASGTYNKTGQTPICPFTLGGSFTLNSDGSGTGSLTEHGCANDLSHPAISFVITHIGPSGSGSALLTLLADSTPIQLSIQVEKGMKVMTFVDLSDPDFYISGVAILN